jgi:hypothetical protein
MPFHAADPLGATVAAAEGIPMQGHEQQSRSQLHLPHQVNPTSGAATDKAVPESSRGAASHDATTAMQASNTHISSPGMSSVYESEMTAGGEANNASQLASQAKYSVPQPRTVSAASGIAASAEAQAKLASINLGDVRGELAFIDGLSLLCYPCNSFIYVK